MEPPPITLSRYIYQSGHFSAANQRIKQNAFLPKRGETRISAATIDGLAEPAVWQIGDVLGRARANPADAIARSDFAPEILAPLNLSLELDTAPHERHVNICGWPEEKEEQKNIAQDLCDQSMLRIR